MNPYQILGITPGASREQIKIAYKNLAKKYHPDISKEPNALEMMKKINGAYDILTKEQIRRPIQQPRSEPVIIFYGFNYGGGYDSNWTSGSSWGY
jgi:molecular chaperone DnaJ